MKRLMLVGAFLVMLALLSVRMAKGIGTGCNVCTFQLKWGSAGSSDGQFNDPFGVAFDGSGNFYVTEFNNNRVQKFDSNGNFLLKWGSAGSGNGQFNSPTGIATGGSLYVADRGNRVQKFGDPATTTAVSYYPVGGVMLPSVGFTVLLPWAIVLSLLGVVSVEAFIVKQRAKPT